MNDVLAALRSLTAINFKLAEPWGSYGKAPVHPPAGRLPLWKFLGELATSDSLAFLGFKGSIIARPATRDVLGYAVDGPMLLMLHADSQTGAGRIRKMWISLHFHEWEVTPPTALSLLVTTKGGVTARVQCKIERRNLEWRGEIEPESKLVEPIESVECSFTTQVRTKLFEVLLPFGARSEIASDGLSVRGLGIAGSADGETSETCQAAWSTGLPADVDRRMSKILRMDLGGVRPSDADLNWFRMQVPSLHRYVLIEIEGAFDRAGKELLPIAFGSKDTDISQFEFHVAGNRAKLLNSTVRAIIGVQVERPIHLLVNLATTDARNPGAGVPDHGSVPNGKQ